MIPFDRPITPPLIYAEYSFPLSVQVNPPADCVNLVQKVATTIANEVSKRAGNNPARMYVYNLLCRANWNNQEFQDVLSKVLWYISIETTKGNYRSTEHAVMDCTEQYLTLYTGARVLEIEALQNSVDPKLVDASLQNSIVSNNLNLEIQHMMQSNYPAQLQNVYQNHGQIPMHQGNHGQPVQNVYQNHGQIPMHQGNHGQPVQYPQHTPQMQVPQQMYQQYNPTQVDQFGRPIYQQAMYPQMANPPMQNMQPSMPMNSFMQQTNQVPSAAGPHVNSNERYSNNSGTLNQKQYFTSAPQPVQVAPAVTDKKEVKEVEYFGGYEMDRSKHTITFMGQQYSMDNVVRSKSFELQVDMLTKAEAFKEEDADIVDGTQMLLDLNENAVITKGVSKRLLISDNSIYRCFAIVANTILSNVKMEDYVNNLAKSRSLSDLAIRMQALAEGFKKSSVEHDADGSQDNTVSVLIAIDNKLTDIVNNYVRNSLRLDAFIDSFSEDYADIEKYIGKELGSKAILSFQAFGGNVLNNFFTTDGDSLLTEARELLDIDESLDCVFLPENYSLTYLPLTDKELGYKLNNDVCFVSPVKTPLLHKVIVSLTEHKKQTQRATLKDLIITQDGKVYRVYQDGCSDGYLIRKD
jgi:hypothetical protein